MQRKRKKGQFFLVGSFFLILMFYSGIAAYLSPPYAGPITGESIEYLFDNIKNEYPRVLNLGLNESYPVETLINFTGFAMNITKGRKFELHTLWLVTENVSNDLNITVGNFLGYSTTVILNVSGDTKEIRVDNGETNSSLFTSPPSEFELNISFNNIEKNLLLEKYKVNLYLILRMSKGNELIAGEIKA